MEIQKNSIIWACLEGTGTDAVYVCGLKKIVMKIWFCSHTGNSLIPKYNYKLIINYTERTFYRVRAQPSMVIAMVLCVTWYFNENRPMVRSSSFHKTFVRDSSFQWCKVDVYEHQMKTVHLLLPAKAII